MEIRWIKRGDKMVLQQWFFYEWRDVPTVEEKPEEVSERIQKLKSEIAKEFGNESGD